MTSTDADGLKSENGWTYSETDGLWSTVIEGEPYSIMLGCGLTRDQLREALADAESKERRRIRQARTKAERKARTRGAVMSNNKRSTMEITSWVGRITAAWQKTLDGIFETGGLLIEAKVKLPHGKFTAMVDHELPFGERTAERLMAIAAWDNRRQVKTTHGSLLPRSWRTLHELSLLPDAAFDKFITSGDITVETTRLQAEQLYQRAIEKIAEKLPITTAAPKTQYVTLEVVHTTQRYDMVGYVKTLEQQIPEQQSDDTARIIDQTIVPLPSIEPETGDGSPALPENAAVPTQTPPVATNGGSRLDQLGCGFNFEQDKDYEDEPDTITRQRAADWQLDEGLRLAKEFALRRPGTDPQEITKTAIKRVRQIARAWSLLADHLEKKRLKRLRSYLRRR
jgi:hypothetical protein